jgi:hypothetical protein
VEVTTFQGQHQVVAVVGRLPVAEPFRERGAVFPAQLEPDMEQRVCELATAGLTALGVGGGVTHTEIKLTSEGPRIIEVNGRLGGHVSDVITRTGGPSLVKADLSLAVGRSPEIGGWTPDGIAFHYLLPAPMSVGRVVRLEGISSVRGWKGVERVSVRARAGSQCDWRQGTGSYLALIEGRVSQYVELTELVNRIEHSVVAQLDEA